jgi:hypothetical protein
MNEAFKKLLKDVFGVKDEVIEKLTAENVSEEVIAGLIPDISTQNRAKWQDIVLKDSAIVPILTDPNHPLQKDLTARGFSAGKGTAYNELKDLVSQTLGVQLDKEGEDYKENAKYAAKLKEAFEKKGGNVSEKEAEIKARIEKEFETRLQSELDRTRTELTSGYEAKMRTMQEATGFENFVMSHGVGKKFKGDLSLNDLLPSIKAKAQGYKWGYDEQGRPAKVMNTEGMEIDNATKDGKLSPSDIINEIYKGFIDTEVGGNGGNGNGGGGTVKDNNGTTTLTGSEANPLMLYRR